MAFAMRNFYHCVARWLARHCASSDQPDRGKAAAGGHDRAPFGRVIEARTSMGAGRRQFQMPFEPILPRKSVGAVWRRAASEGEVSIYLYIDAPPR
jgi:hypothetical protein